MVFKINNILSESELNGLQQFIKENKSYDSIPNNSDDENKKNYYYRKAYQINLTLSKKITRLVKEKLGVEYKIIDCWVNFVFNDSNKNDDFHFDKSDLSFIIYLNDDFEGGEFEYIDYDAKKIQKIKPKKNLGLITSDGLLHRVLNVKKGIRYSLIIFLKKKQKKVNTII